LKQQIIAKAPGLCSGRFAFGGVLLANCHGAGVTNCGFAGNINPHH
jgi:hypothetical protein